MNEGDTFIPKGKLFFVDNPIGPPIRQEYPLNLSISLAEEKKLTRIPSVTASEAGIAQTENLRSCSLER